MLRKKLIIFYHLGPGNKDIAESDFDKFYKPLKDRIDANKDITCDYALCPDADAMVSKLEKLVAPEAKLDELYLHFSGHGAKDGIPYKDWILLNKDFVSSLRHPKVKFCFFSSCQSAELVKLASGADIPVVIGTNDNNIENDYAIHFQKTFYARLSESFTYKVSFEKAVAEANRECKRNADSNVIIRGEGGGDFSDLAEINELQLILELEAGEDEYLIPPNWVMKMNEAGYDKPWCLNWFDDAIERKKFYDKLKGEGLDEILNWEDMPTNELNLLEKRVKNKNGDGAFEKENRISDPFMKGTITILFHCTKKEELPDEIRSFLQKKKLPNEKHINVIICNKKSVRISKQTVALIDSYPGIQQFVFKDSSESLFTDQFFIAALDKVEIQSSERRKITLDFEFLPLKKEIYENVKEEQFVRIFFGRNSNENLINYVANWLKFNKNPGTKLFVADNGHNTQLNLLEDLEKQLQIHFNNNEKLEAQLHSLYFNGGLIILRNRSLIPNSGVEILQALLMLLKEAANAYDVMKKLRSLEDVKNPTIVFLLNDVTLMETDLDHTRICYKPLANPNLVNMDMIENWVNKYSPTSSASDIVVKNVKKIAGNLKPQVDPNECPSKVIEFICTDFKIPQKNILKI